MKQLTVKDRIKAIYFTASFILFIGLDVEYTSGAWIALIAANFATSVAVIRKVNFDTVK